MSDLDNQVLTTNFTYANTEGYQKDRIFDPYTYRHNYDEDQLEELLLKYVTDLYVIEEKCVKLLDEIDQNKYLSKYDDGLNFWGNRIRYFRVILEVIFYNLRNYFNSEDDIRDSSMSMKMKRFNRDKTNQSIEVFEDLSNDLTPEEKCFGDPRFAGDRLEILTQEFQFMDIAVLTQIFKGVNLINVSATTTVVNWVVTVLNLINEAFDTLDEKDNRDNNKNVFCLIMKLSFCFDFLYSAMIWDPKSTYYNLYEDNYLEDKLEYVDVEDEQEYWRLADEGYFEIGKIIGVASRTFKHKSKFRQFISFIGWMPFYFLFNRKKGSAQGFFFMNVLNKKVFKRMNTIYEMSTYKKVLKLSSPKIEKEVKIYVTMPKEDGLISGSNLKNKKLPKMVSEDLDLPFEVEQKNYDPTEFIKIRLISTDKWDHINWKNGRLKDPAQEVIHYPVGLLFVHGGAFISGSSSSYQNILKKYALETGYPVFAVDYRLAPDHPYPLPLSDWWLAYLWMRHYSEKYLGVRFDKIILIGDSAGGCISLSMSTLSIRKKVTKPDGMVLAYPGTCLDRTYFTPSCMMALDEPYLNANLIDLCLKSYVADHATSSHYLCSPIYTPKKYLKQMPPTRVGIAGVDPLRDTGIELVRKFKKAGVDCSGKVYKQLFHGYLEMDSYPFYMKDWEKAFFDTIDFLEEVISI